MSEAPKMQHQIGQKFIFRLKSQEIYEMHKVSCTRQFVLLHIFAQKRRDRTRSRRLPLFRCFFRGCGRFGKDHLFLQHEAGSRGDVQFNVVPAVKTLGSVGLFCHVSKAAVLFVVGRQNHRVLARLANRDKNVVQGITEVEVEHEHQPVAVVGKGLLRRFHQQQVCHSLVEPYPRQSRPATGI